jgi:hypothetical protein
VAEPVLWVGGWASGLACWRSELEALYPGRPHLFLDAHDLLGDRGRLRREAAALPAGCVIAGWSLGSLLLHLDLLDGGFPEGRILSLSPIFDFCGEGAPWSRAVLARMIRRLPRSRAEVLAEFWNLVKGGSPVPPEASSAWIRQAEGYSLDALVAGLEALGSLAADPSALEARPGIAFVASARDPLAPPPRGRVAGSAWTFFPGGHLPFLDFPDIVRPLLDAPA